MGFPENGCKRACLAVGNSGTEAAMEWVFGHMEDADFDAPLPGAFTGLVVLSRLLLYYALCCIRIMESAGFAVPLPGVLMRLAFPYKACCSLRLLI